MENTQLEQELFLSNKQLTDRLKLKSDNEKNLYDRIAELERINADSKRCHRRQLNKMKVKYKNNLIIYTSMLGILFILFEIFIR